MRASEAKGGGHGLLASPWIRHCGGAGSSNDGNTARRAFRNEKTFAEITRVSEELIHRLHAILQAMACGHRIDPVQFGKHCDGTAELFVAEYLCPLVPHACLRA